MALPYLGSLGTLSARRQRPSLKLILDQRAQHAGRRRFLNILQNVALCNLFIRSQVKESRVSTSVAGTSRVLKKSL